jgi:large subunit ribosomal protein L6
MSRIGQKPVAIPSGVTVELDGQSFKAKGPNGELAMTFVDEVEVKREDDNIIVLPRGKSKRERMMWGMQRTLVSNIVVGVTEGFKIELEIVGVGYRAAVEGNKINLQLGFSHDVLYDIPEGIKVECPKPTSIVISGADRQVVGQVAAEIRSYRKPEPYKGKGVRYLGEQVYRKEGKKK